MKDDSSDWQEMLRRIFGEKKAREMEDKIRQGEPFSLFEGGEGVFAFPLQTLLSNSGEAVNWELARMTALGRIGTQPRAVTHAEAIRVREGLSQANLRLDPVTTLSPPQADYEAWNETKWLEASAGVWKVLVTPVAESTAAAMTAALKNHLGDGDLRIEISNGPAELRNLLGLFSKDGNAESLQVDGLLKSLAANLFGLQFGQAWASLATESFGACDIGLPVGKPDQAALVLENIEKFAADSSLDSQPVLDFLATREAAYIRLFHAVPWLRVFVTKAITDFAKDITFDLQAMDEALNSVNPTDLHSVDELLGKGFLTPQTTGKQTAAKQSLEMILAVMEGWVDTVTTRCLAGVLPELAPLREMMNRRRANGGPAEKTFAALIGMELRPKRLREASALWTKLVAKLGEAGAERLWDHPDILPEESDFDDVDGFVARLSGEEPPDELESSLEALLDGTLGYAKGLKPGADSEGDSLQ
ncbi:putative hydrolase [Mobiluncus mulieris FB024-16]|uniref:zinc-dependent metalloprotease n=1 Tax=Mobiluncus mulieris TaxID=2052 RepID=UPI0001E5192E|nr:zinc-dependent metalloprotease [Mobiluncus mulieris]EFN93719.1 putative hydrolase [Mobiluncus mulieris FB024-16]